MGSQSWSHLALWSYGFARPRDKQKPLYLPYQNAVHHQTWQDGNIFWQAPNYKFSWPFDHVILRDYMANLNYYISATIVHMGDQYWKDNDFPKGAPNHKVT